MKSEIMAVAFGDACGRFGNRSNFSGSSPGLNGSARRSSSPKSHASAVGARLMALVARKWRREEDTFIWQLMAVATSRAGSCAWEKDSPGVDQPSSAYTARVRQE